MISYKSSIINGFFKKRGHIPLFWYESCIILEWV
ncbi:hypothetical protein HRbin16_02414 [bacterium HR16]|nr:hypothetical protein HRbin16_02414 [bacterium HR16]